jgi:biotin carboxylase
MKSLFVKHGIPTVKYRLLKKNFSENELDGMTFPLVIKPLDSQGQRGVYKLDGIQDIRSLFSNVLSYSREKEVLAEEYYESDEITVSGWVRDGQATILTVTDRIVYNNYPHIGICAAHNFPSKYADLCRKEIKDITDGIVKGFGIHNGPIYFQMLVGKDGIKVNEVACRIGGAYEDEMIPLITGVDILGMLINGSLGEKIDFLPLERYNLKDNQKRASVRMIFTRPGKIASLSSLDELKKAPGLKYAKYNFSSGHEVSEIANATQRAGYMIIEGDNPEMLRKNISEAFDRLKIHDEKGENMVLSFLTDNALLKEFKAEYKKDEKYIAQS